MVTMVMMLHSNQLINSKHHDILIHWDAPVWKRARDWAKITFQCRAAPSELPERSRAARLQQGPHQKEVWGRENWPPAQTENMKLYINTAALHSEAAAAHFLLTLSMLRSFICRTRSSTGLRVISASENGLKSPNTADEYNLHTHTHSTHTFASTVAKLRKP